MRILCRQWLPRPLTYTVRGGVRTGGVLWKGIMLGVMMGVMLAQAAHKARASCSCSLIYSPESWGRGWGAGGCFTNTSGLKEPHREAGDKSQAQRGRFSIRGQAWAIRQKPPQDLEIQGETGLS